MKLPRSLRMVLAVLGVCVLCAAGGFVAGVLYPRQVATLLGLGPPPQKDRVLDAAARAQVLDGLVQNLRTHYVFPEKAVELERRLRERQQQGAYDAVTSAEALGELLTAQLQADAKDKHLRVRYSETPLKPSATDGTVTAMAQADLTRLNYGFEQVGRLNFNIGYLDLRAFAPQALIAERLAAAMTLLADTRALVIDLRKNGGGDPETVALVASYLFEQRTRLNDIAWRKDGRITEGWTRADVAGRRYGAARPVYVLTSEGTFSAAEDFAYALKNLKRAVVVGERTGGGAHPGDVQVLTPHFGAFIPSARSVSPVTGTNWEGVGVEPDVAVPADEALDVAQVRILRGFLEQERDPEMRERLASRISELE